MGIEVLKSKIKNFTHIVHVADVHIRLLKRNDEYREVFEKLYKEVEKTPKETLVCLLGDIFHNKSDLSPESVQLAKDFFKQLADRRPVVLIAGNHDTTLANKNRLDSLTPVVETLNHDNLYYLKHTGLYGLSNILFNNMSVFDSVDKYIKYEDIPDVYKNQYEHHIALFHGPVDNALTDIGYKVSNKSIKTSLFDGHKIVLLGDIHMLQDLQHYDKQEQKPIIHFAGSLIQQNHGEDLKNHGFSLWDLNKVEYTHFDILNDYGFFTVELDKGNLVTDITNIPKKARLRVKCFETVATEVKAVLAHIRKHSDVTEVTYVRLDSPDDKSKLSINSNIQLGDLSNVSYQNKLIKEYLKSVLKIEDNSIIDCVIKLNEEVNAALPKEDTSKNIRWKPKRFEFENMFSYGEENVIDFSKLKDVVGLFANNASGKSSILSALMFCIFDKCDRAFKASHVLNTQKVSFSCKFNFEINGVDYFIKRKGLADKKGNVKVDVEFWKQENGKTIQLNSEDRRSTNDIIRDYLGSYEDFILTTMSIQNVKNVASFIDMGHTERKDLLAQFMGLTIFDKIYNYSNEKYKEYSILLKNYKNDDFTKKLLETSNGLTAFNSKYNEEVESLKNISEQREILQNSILEETKKLLKLELDVDGDFDVDESFSQKEKLKKSIIELNEELKKEVEQCDLYSKKITEVESVLAEIEKKNVDETFKLYKSIEKEFNEINFKIDLKKSDVKNKLDKLDKLKEHEYDPNCSFCVNNIFVKDAVKTREELLKDKEDADKLLNSKITIQHKMEELSWVVEEHNNKSSILSSLNSLKNSLSTSINSKNKTKESIEFSVKKVESIEKDIDIYNKNKEAIKKNKDIESEIQSLKSKLSSIDYQSKIKNKNILELNSKLTLLRDSIEKIKEKVEAAKKLEGLYVCYEKYIQCVCRDGIPYEVISNTLPEIEKEVNNILHQIVDFNISMETDGKNVVSYIVYDNKKWPLELSSGMEKFISSLAIRVALINVSNLPRPNFICIDEGWGVLDSDNVSSVKMLLDFLKHNFDFVLTISHLDSLKDMVDNRLEIQREKGFSKVNFE